MGIELHLSGADELIAALRHRSSAVQDATLPALVRAATVVKEHAVAMLSLSSHPPGTPTPSAPGQPPSLITGELRRSIETTWPTAMGSGSQGRYTIAIGPTAVYGRIQELGGRAGRGSTLPARPYMAPALRAAKDDIGHTFSDAWGDAWS